VQKEFYQEEKDSIEIFHKDFHDFMKAGRPSSFWNLVLGNKDGTNNGRKGKVKKGGNKKTKRAQKNS
jgi:hypothetical protein